MSFYQNVFPWEFIGNWVLGDRQASLSFRCPANTGRGDELVQSYGGGRVFQTFNLAGADLEGNATSNLRIWFARDYELSRNWTMMTVAIAGVVPAVTTINEIIALLNADVPFSQLFEASAANNYSSVIIRQRLPKTKFRFYIDNRGAETALLFNARAGVAELPCYFDRDTIRRRFAFTDFNNYLIGNNHLIELSHVITEITSAADSVSTSFAHGLATGDTIIVANSNSVVSINSAGAAVVALSNDTFSFNPVVNTIAGAKGNYAVWARLVDNQIIANATDKLGNPLNYTLAGVRRDYQLLHARSGLFDFTINTADPATNTRPIRSIVFNAGAVAGDMAKIIKYTYAGGANTTVILTTEEPYILTPADITATVPSAPA